MINVPIELFDLLCDFVGIKGIQASPYPHEELRGKFRDSWVIAEKHREGWYVIYCTRQEYKDEFEKAVNQFMSVVYEDSKGAIDEEKNTQN